MSDENEIPTPFQAFTDGMSLEHSNAAEAFISQGVEAPIAWAIATAMRDFISTTGTNAAGEEHRTSALMGFIATSMGVFHRLALISGERSDARLLWHATRKQSSAEHGPGEDKIGGDFGVAVPLPDDKYRISFFQAKNRKSEGRLNISSAPKSDGSVGWKIKAAAADHRLELWAVDNRVTEKGTEDVDHQILKLARTQRRGRELAGEANEPSTRDWVHYIAWSNAEPICFTLDSCRIEKSAKERFKPTGSNTAEVIKAVTQIQLDPDRTFPFAGHLVSGMCSDAKGWIELSKADAKTVVGEFVELGADWYIVDDETGRGAKGLTDDRAYRLNTAASTASAPAVLASTAVARERKTSLPKPGGGG